MRARLISCWSAYGLSRKERSCLPWGQVERLKRRVTGSSRKDALVLPRQRIRRQLKLHHLALLPFAALDVPDRTARIGRPDRLALPAGVGIVDAAVETLGVEAHRIRHAQRHEL